jgi:hypothetical protein
LTAAGGRWTSRLQNRNIFVHIGGMNSGHKTVRSRIEKEKRKRQKFFELAERFRNATDPKEAKRLGDKLGRIVFGG